MWKRTIVDLSDHKETLDFCAFNVFIYARFGRIDKAPYTYYVNRRREEKGTATFLREIINAKAIFVDGERSKSPKKR